MLLDQAAIQLDDDSVLMLRQMYLASLARTSRKTSALPGPGSFLEHPEDNCKQLSAECPGLLILLDYSACQLSSPSISAAWGNSSRRPPRQPLTCQFRVGPTSTHASITCAQSSLDLSSRAITQRAHNVGVQFQFQVTPPLNQANPPKSRPMADPTGTRDKHRKPLGQTDTHQRAPEPDITHMGTSPVPLTAKRRQCRKPVPRRVPLPHWAGINKLKISRPDTWRRSGTSSKHLHDQDPGQPFLLDLVSHLKVLPKDWLQSERARTASGAERRHWCSGSCTTCSPHDLVTLHTSVDGSI